MRMQQAKNKCRQLKAELALAQAELKALKMTDYPLPSPSTVSPERFKTLPLKSSLKKS
jgi:hypothetical protein